MILSDSIFSYWLWSLCIFSIPFLIFIASDS